MGEFHEPSRKRKDVWDEHKYCYLDDMNLLPTDEEHWRDSLPGSASGWHRMSCRDQQIELPWWQNESSETLLKPGRRDGIKQLMPSVNYNNICSHLTTSEQAAQLARVAVLHLFWCHLQTVWDSQETAHYTMLRSYPISCVKEVGRSRGQALYIVMSLEMIALSDWKVQGLSLTGVDWRGVFLESWLMLNHGCFHANNKPTTYLHEISASDQSCKFELQDLHVFIQACKLETAESCNETRN